MHNGTPLTLVRRAVPFILAASDACTRSVRLDKLDVVIVPEAGAARGVARGRVLSTVVAWVETAELLGADAAGDWGVCTRVSWAGSNTEDVELTLDITGAVGTVSFFEIHVRPEIRRELTLHLGVAAVALGTVCLSTSEALRFNDVGVGIHGHNHAWLRVSVCTKSMINGKHTRNCLDQ